MLDRAREFVWKRPRLLLVAVAALAWSTSIHRGYVGYDTPWLVVDNHTLSEGGWAAIPDILWGVDRGTRLVLGAEYLPVRDLTVLFDHMVFGKNWEWHHLHNLFWYLAGCLLFLEVCARLLGRGLRAWFASALFALHPVHVESVAWLASRKDVVSLAFFMGAVLAWLLGQRALVVLAFALAYWSKNTAVVLPAVLVAISLLHRRDRPTWRWWLQWLPLGGVALLGLGISLKLGAMVAMMAPTRADSAWGLLVIQCKVLWDYAVMILWPGGLSVIYVEPGPAADGLFLAGLAVCLSGVLAAAWGWRHNRTLTLGLVWAAVGLAPVSQLVSLQNLMADRYLLLPTAGLALALAAVVPRRPLVLPAALVACLGLGLATSQRNLVWHSTESLWSDAAHKQPYSARAWASLVDLYVAAGQHDRARLALDEGFSYLPDNAILLQAQGGLALATGDAALAEESYRRAKDMASELRKSSRQLMVVLARQGRFEEAVPIGEALVAVHPLWDEGWLALGRVYLEVRPRRLDDARRCLLMAHELNPTDPAPLVNLGQVGWFAQDGDEAWKWWNEALKLDPDNEQAAAGLKALQGR